MPSLLLPLGLVDLNTLRIVIVQGEVISCRIFRKGSRLHEV